MLAGSFKQRPGEPVGGLARLVSPVEVRVPLTEVGGRLQVGTLAAAEPHERVQHDEGVGRLGRMRATEVLLKAE